MHHQSRHERHVTSDTQHPANDSQTAGRLLEDVQGKWLNGSNPDSVKKLVDSGILPAGSNIIDFGEVKKHLSEDQKKLEELGKTASVNGADAHKELDAAKGKQADAQKNLDGAQKAVDEVQGRMDKRKQQDGRMQSDFQAVSTALDKETVYKEDLRALVKDASKPQELRDAAQRMLDTVHSSGGRGNHDTGDYSDIGWGSGKTYFDKKSIAAGVEKHKKENEADSRALAPLTAKCDEAKSQKVSADAAVVVKQTAVDKIDGDNRTLEDTKAKLAQQIKDEQDALKPQGELDKLGRVVSGGGYYQVAERLLGLDKKGHSQEQERELKLLTRMLQEEAKELNNGHLPPYLKANDQLLKPENLERVLEKIRQATVAAPPAPVAK
jgi:hypothetical protein